MSMHSVDDFDPSSSKPVFGGAVTQTKTQEQQQPTNNPSVKEKLCTPPQSVVNGQNGTTNNENSDNLGNDTNESVRENTIDTADTTDVHVNGQNGDRSVDALPPVNATTKDDVNSAEESISASAAPDPIENSSQNDPLLTSPNEPSSTVASTDLATVKEPAPVESASALSVSENVAKKDSPSAPVTNANNTAPPPPGPPTEETSTISTISSESIPASATAPEATVLAESVTPERKSKSPRVSKAKSPAVSTPPKRQSTRAKKPTSASSNYDDENRATEESGTSTALTEPSPSPKRVKRQAATIAQDAIQASTQATSTSGSSSTEEVVDPTDQDVIPSDVDNDADVIEEKSKRKTPSPRKGARASTTTGRKRGASSSPSVSPAKKKKVSPRGNKLATSSNDEQQMDVDTTTEANDATTPSEIESDQTTPKKARTSGSRKTPTATTPEPSGDYVRKLRPRK